MLTPLHANAKYGPGVAVRTHQFGNDMVSVGRR